MNLRKDSLTVNAQDARGIANDYTRLLEYITELQDRVVEVQLDGDTF
jgi:hypothetical protein